MTEVFDVSIPSSSTMDVVFLHGLDGDGRKSWTAGGDLFWPGWLADDVPGIAVRTVDYDAWSSRWRGQAMSLPDRAMNLLALLQNHEIGGRPLCFVAHSMGGLLVKEMLLHAAEGRDHFASFAQFIQGVVFLATPHTGSGLTKAVDALGRLYRGTPAVGDLKRNGAHLRQLNDRYRDWADGTDVRHLVLFEARTTGAVRVVDEASSNPGIARVRPIPVDADHVTIIKPTSRRDLVYGQVKRFITDLVLQPRTEPAQAAHRRVDVRGTNRGIIIAGDGNNLA